MVGTVQIRMRPRSGPDYEFPSTNLNTVRVVGSLANFESFADLVLAERLPLQNLS
jgi:hypothetical protein